MSVMIGATAVTSAGTHGRGLGIATLATWLLTAGLGGYMLRTWLARGGLRRQAARSGGLPPAVIFGHFGLAITGLAVWIGYVATAWAPLAWSAAFLLTPTVGLGIAMVTLWTPYPAAPVMSTDGPVAAGPRDAAPAGSMLAAPPEDILTSKLTDHVLARALTDDVLAGKLADDVLARMPTAASRVRKPKGHLAPLIPVGHGLAAVTTVLLALLTAVSSR